MGRRDTPPRNHPGLSQPRPASLANWREHFQTIMRDTKPNMPVPEGWEVKPLNQLLTLEQFKAMHAHVLAKHGRGKMVSGKQLIDALVEYFKTIKADLEAKGIDPEFLAYAILAAFQQSPQFKAWEQGMANN